jgi:hypothetical protein
MAWEFAWRDSTIDNDHTPGSDVGFHVLDVVNELFVFRGYTSKL